MSGKNETVVTRKSDRELVVTRLFNGPARIVFEAWSKPELFQRWWVPKALGVPLRACEMDVRTGGGYRLEFGLDAANSMAFFGKYTDVTRPRASSGPTRRAARSRSRRSPSRPRATRRC